jgi:hypothetical protein
VKVGDELRFGMKRYNLIAKIFVIIFVSVESMFIGRKSSTDCESSFLRIRVMYAIDSSKVKRCYGRRR